MRVLFLTPYVPSPIRARPYQFIRHLTSHGHKVTLICLAAPNEEPAALAELRRCCHEVVLIPTSRTKAAWQMLRALPSRLPLQAAYGASVDLVSEAQQRADRHDVIHIEHLRGSTYGPPLRDHPTLLDAVDCISLLFERAFRQSPSLASRARALLDLARTRHAEGRFGDIFGLILVTSTEDRWALRQLQSAQSPVPRIEALPIGVDLTAFAPAPLSKREPATLVLSGKMSYHANEAAALYLVREIMPEIWRRRPEVQCTIVGRDPTPLVRSLGADTRVRITGAVESIVPFLSCATIAVVPLRYGVGTQYKVLEAMATATPVVATPQATQALNIRPDSELLVAETSALFASAVLNLLDDPIRLEALGAAGRSYVERHHDWHQITDDLVQLYSQIGSLPQHSARHAGSTHTNSLRE
jgi:glycosyltransferase involved in cell wall biosynthesis